MKSCKVCIYNIHKIGPKEVGLFKEESRSAPENKSQRFYLKFKKTGWLKRL